MSKSFADLFAEAERHPGYWVECLRLDLYGGWGWRGLRRIPGDVARLVRRLWRRAWARVDTREAPLVERYRAAEGYSPDTTPDKTHPPGPHICRHGPVTHTHPDDEPRGSCRTGPCDD